MGEPRRSKMLAALVIALMGVGLALAQTRAREQREAPNAVHKIVMPSQLSWGKPPPGLPPGAETAVLDGNPARPGLYVLRLRLPDGYAIRPHWHTLDEHLTVISGRLAMGMGGTWDQAAMKDLPPGAYVSMPGKATHFAIARGETIVELANLGPFDINYVNPSDDPRLQRSSR